MALFDNTLWSAIAHTPWSYWSSTAWKNIGWILEEINGGGETLPSIFRKLDKEKRDSIITVKLILEGVDPIEIQKRINKGIKVTVDDLEFVKREIEIRNIKL